MSENKPSSSEYKIRKGQVRSSSKKDFKEKISSTNADSHLEQDAVEIPIRPVRKPRKTSMHLVSEKQPAIFPKTKTQLCIPFTEATMQHIRNYLLYNSKPVNEMISSGKVSEECIDSLLQDNIVKHQVQQQAKMVNPYQMSGMKKVEQTFCRKVGKQLQLKEAEIACESKKNQISDMINRRLRKLEGMMG